MKIYLTSEQRIALKMLNKNSRDSRVRDRIRCAIFAADGWTAAMIAQSQLIDETSVRRHLREPQTAELIAYLTDNLQPDTQAIIEWVDVQWGIRYTVPGMNKWLHRNNFSDKKPGVLQNTVPNHNVCSWKPTTS